MSNDSKESAAPQRSRTGCLIWSLVAFGGLAFFVTCWLLWQGLPGEKIVVSRDTTYITEPLRSDGLPDYEAYLLEQYRAGVTPENNTGVLLYQAIWPGELESNDYQAVCDELGLDSVPAKEGALHEFPSDQLLAAVKTWLASHNVAAKAVDHESRIAEDAAAAENTVDDEYAEQALSIAGASAWTTSDLPPLAQWLTANQATIDLVVAATQRSHLYLPSPSLLNDDHEMLIAMLLPGVQGTRYAGRALALRAVHHLGEGRLDEAWNDTLALHRLASLVAQTQTIVEQLVAIAIRGMANDATLAILSDDRLSLELARRIRADLAQLDRRANLRQKLTTLDRIATVDAAIHTSIDGFQVMSEDPVASSPMASPNAVNWNIVLKVLNYWYDRIEQAVALSDVVERQQAIEVYESDLDESGRIAKHPSRSIYLFFSRDARSTAIAAIFANLMLPAVTAAITAEERNTATAQLVDVAAALAEYRAEHGHCPAALADLTPDILPQLPTDPIRAKDLVYKREGAGYLLYSLGQNGNDDGGSNELMSVVAGRRYADVAKDEQTAHLQETPPTADDYSILMPRPRFKLPASAASDP